MIIKTLKFCHISLFVFFEILGAFALALLALMCILFWQLSQGPVEITFAADTIKKAIISSDHKTDLQFDSIVAEWPEFSGPISIGLSGVRLNENGKPVLTIPQLGIRIAKTPLLIGSIHPEAVIIKDATIRLSRSKDGGVHLLVNDQVNSPSVDDSSDQKNQTTVREFGEALFEGGTLPDYHQIEPLANLQKFVVQNSHVIIIDEELGTGWNIPRLDFEALREPNQFRIIAQYQEGKDFIANFSFLLERSPSDESIRFSSEIDKINASTLGRLFFPLKKDKGPQFIVKSKMDGQLDKDWSLVKLEGGISSEQGQLNLDGLYKTPLKFSNLKANIAYDSVSQKIILRDTQIDINKRTVFMSGEKSAKDKTSIFDLKIHIPEFTLDEMQSVWPEDMRHSIAADWLTKRLSQATIKNLNVLIPVDIYNPANTNTEKLQGSFDFENLTSDYRAPLIPATNSIGKTTLKDDVLTIDIASGNMGDMIIKRGKITIPYLTHPTKVGDVSIDADITGPIAAALNYVALDPISLGDKIGIKTDAVKGQAVMNAKVSFPALADLPKDEVRVIVDAQLNDVVLPSVVRGMELTGGPYQLSVNAGAVTISGKGALNSQPIDLNYIEYINLADAPYLSSIKADIISNRALREKFGVNIDQFIEGDVPVKIVYQENKNLDETIQVQADLKPAIVKFSPFKYRKAEGKNGQATCDVLIQNGEVRHIQNLKISIDKAGSATGNLYFGKVGKQNDVKTGQFKNVTLAGANNLNLDFTQTAPNVYDVTVTGKQIDGRPFLGGQKDLSVPDKTSGDVSRVNATIKVAQMKTGDKSENMLFSPDITLKTDAKGDVAFLDLKGNFDKGSVSVTLKPNSDGKTVLQIKSGNAGGALRALDIYDHMIGGQLDVRGIQIAGAGINDITGHGLITNFTIVKAPFLAKLINLFSLSGLTELLQDKGIEFKSLKTNFAWREVKTGRVISLQNGMTTGASIGLTFGGIINQDNGTMDISGTFVPMSQINSVVSKIPILGNLLTGGKNGGVIAATYAMKGSSNNPNVTLNPLSVLTPGFLRSILFENDKNVFDEDGETQETLPSVKKGFNP